MRSSSPFRNGFLAAAVLVASAAAFPEAVTAQAPGDWDGLVNRINRLQEQIYDLRDAGGGAVPLQGSQLGAPADTMDPAEAANLTLRISNLEGQLRQLTGQIEEIAFQVQQMNERLKRFSEDVEFRFQELAQGRGRSGDAGGQVPRTTATAGVDSGSLLEPDDAPRPLAGTELSGGNVYGSYTDLGGAAPPRVLGTIPGSLLEGGQSGAGRLDGGSADNIPFGQSAAGGSLVPEEVTTQPLETVGGADSGPEGLYKSTHEKLLRRQFADAEIGFKQFLRKYPDHKLAGNARYWLGETYYARRQYKLAAEEFLKGYQDYPKGPKAADSLVKLGMTLNRLGQQKQACAALVEAEKRFPGAQEVRKIAAQERSRVGC